MPFGNFPPNRQPLECLGPQRFSNPKGIASSSPGLRGPRYPGSRTGEFSTPTGLRPAAAAGAQPRWGCGSSGLFPRVARASQPWALWRNPVGFSPGIPEGIRIKGNALREFEQKFVPEGHPIIAQRFNAGLPWTETQSPGGTAEPETETQFVLSSLRDSLPFRPSTQR